MLKLLNFYRFSFLFLLVISLNFLPTLVYAQRLVESELHHQQLESLSQQLLVIKERNKITETKYRDLAALRKQQKEQLKAIDVDQKLLQRTRLNLTIAHTELNNAEDTLKDSQEKLVRSRITLRNAKNQLQEFRVATIDKEKPENIVRLQAEVDFQQELNQLENQRFTALQEAKTIVANIVDSEEKWLQHLQELYEQHQHELREAHLKELTQEQQLKQRQLLSKLTLLNEQLKAYETDVHFTDPAGILLGVRIFQIEEEIYLSQLDVKLSELEDSIDNIIALQSSAKHLDQIDVVSRRLTDILAELNLIEKRVQAKFASIENNQKILTDSKQQNILSSEQVKEFRNILQELADSFQQYHERVVGLTKQSEAYQQVVRHDLSKAVAERQGLPGLDVKAWFQLGSSLVQIPAAVFALLQVLSDHLSVAMKGMHYGWLILLFFLESLWLLGCMIGRKFLLYGIHSLQDKLQLVSANILFVTLQLLYRNWLGLVILGSVIGLLLFFNVPYKIYQLLFYLALVWFGFRFLIGIARLSLVETMSNVYGRDVQLYYRLKKTFLFGGLITAFTVLTHHLNVAYEVRDLSSRLFMLFILLVSLVLWRARHVVPSLFATHFEQPRRYLQKAISLLCMLIPLSLLANTLVGLVGYVQLAWIMSYYQMVFLLVLTGYIIARGILVDGMDIISTASIKHLRNGWLWSNAVLNPLDRILRLVLLILALIVLFVSFGLTSQSPLVQQFNYIIHYPFFFKDGLITLLSITEFAISLAVLYWLARWTREFSYRWFYNKIRDRSIRNSFAIFTQYIMVFIAGLLTLRILGVGLSGLNYVLGGLAFGIGLGLRDYANNLMSGIFLLIERPVKEGDFVSVSGYEGEVVHIGMRSLTVKSWDHMEVLVPNAELFSKTFTNWTHQDSIIRTVISIKLQRQDDPRKVQGLIWSVLQRLEPVLKDPAPQVYMKEISEALIEFDVRYFMNLEKYTRVEIRSVVLFELWEEFERHGIKPPYSHQNIHLLDDKSV